MDTIEKKPNLGWMDAPIRSDTWKAIIFAKSGKSDVSDESFCSESEALAFSTEQGTLIKNGGWEWLCDDGTIIGDGMISGRLVFSHFIQVPIKA